MFHPGRNEEGYTWLQGNRTILVKKQISYTGNHRPQFPEIVRYACAVITGAIITIRSNRGQFRRPLHEALAGPQIIL